MMMMNDISKELVNEEVLIIYIDHILIFSWTKEQHQEVILQVLNITRSTPSTSRQKMHIHAAYDQISGPYYFWKDTSKGTWSLPQEFEIGWPQGT